MTMTTRALRRLGALALAACLSAAACSSGSLQVQAEGPDDATPLPTPTPVDETPDPPTELPGQADLDAARTRWAEAGIDRYVYSYTRSCECEHRGPFRVTVNDGTAGVVDVFGEPPDVTAQTVEDLFARIESAIAEGVQTAVTYDDTDGHPISVQLDLEAMAVDGGYSIEVSELIDLAGPLAEIDDAQARWEASGVTSYEMTYREVCFCPEILIRVTVVDGEVVDTVSLGEFEPSPPGRTVDDLFRDVRDALSGGAVSVSAAYEPQLGYPTEYFIDYAANIADEEFGVTVEELVPA